MQGLRARGLKRGPVALSRKLDHGSATKTRTADPARTPPRYTGDFLAGDVWVRSLPVLCTFERGSANSGRTTVWTGK